MVRQLGECGLDRIWNIQLAVGVECGVQKVWYVKGLECEGCHVWRVSLMQYETGLNYGRNGVEYEVWKDPE